MNKSLHVSVPGNLLLAGEYLVLEPGGPGLAIAVEPRVKANAVNAKGWSVKALMAGGQEGSQALPLADAVFAACFTALRRRSLPPPRPLAITIDSSACFDAAGRKTGFGSSAAAAAAMALLIGRATGLAGQPLQDFALESALAGHRQAQGGQGSGYDIYASIYGGNGLFCGGSTPSWRQLDQLPLHGAALLAGPRPVSTREAVTAYRTWRSTVPAAGVSILSAMHNAVLDLAAASTAGDACCFRSALDRAQQAGLALGEAIGCSAHIDLPEDCAGCSVKALGAGNELGLLYTLDMARTPVFHGQCTVLPFQPTGGPAWFM